MSADRKGTTAGTAPVPLARLVGSDGPELQRYEVSGLIGEGAMGSVYLGFDKRLDREVAIKVIGEGQLTPEARTRFYREAKLTAALNHPNIVKVLDYSGPELETQFIVMERLHGQSLQALIERSAFPEPIAAIVCMQIAEALQHAHAQKLIHRDLKPANVIVEPDGRVVLIDFGLVKGLKSDGARATFVGSKTEVVGTPLFSSPEQIFENGELGPKSDLYSLGATTYYMLSQVAPFRGANMLELLRAIGSAPLTPIDSLIDCGPDTRALVEALLAREPKERIASAGDAVKRCRAIIERHKLSWPADALAAFVNGQALPAREVTSITQKTPLPRADEEPTAKTTITTRADDATAKMTLKAIDPKTQVVTAPKTIATTGVSRKDEGPPWLIIAAIGIVVLLASVLGVRWLRMPAAQPAAPVVASPSAPPLGNTVLFVVAQPWGDVWIDGEKRGRTPAVRRFELAAGAHEISVRHPTLGDRVERIELKGEPERELVFDLTAKP
ncbi:MAG: serine/threonine protein kinase [Deltaproteobacteria bacterium]|nr:serine/threonine protein kinase [Deltaproteobacteria bacterium]